MKLIHNELGKEEKDKLIQTLLSHLREQTGGLFLSDEACIYFAHLLFAMLLSDFHEMAEPYLSENSGVILKHIKATEDKTIKYFIFKVNADSILIRSAIYPEEYPNTVTKHSRELAKFYYEQAASYHARIYRKKTGVGQVLLFLYENYDPVFKFLKSFRYRYLAIIHKQISGTFCDFEKEFNDYDKEFARKVLIDDLLDFYNQAKDRKNYNEMKQLKERLQDATNAGSAKGA